MSHEDWADGLLLEAQRQADPSELDVARNLAGVEQRLGLLGGSDGPSGDGGNGAATAAGTLLQLRPGVVPGGIGAPAARAARVAGGGTWAATLGRWLAFGAAGAVFGYLGGRAESRREIAELEQRSELQAQQLEEQRQDQREREEQQRRREREEQHQQALEPERLAGPAKQRETPPRQPSRAHRAPALLRLAQPPASPPRTPANQELRQAIELLQRAEATLRAGDAFSASLLLSDLDRSAPAALLHEERLAARALVSCALGEVEPARAALRELEQLNGHSIYRARLEGSCAEKTSASAPKDALPTH